MALHTYEFYKNRRHDPKWRSAYIKFRNQRIIQMIIGIIVVLFLLTLAALFLNYMTTYNLTSNDLNLEVAKDFFGYCLKDHLDELLIKYLVCFNSV
jgi:hypothetical protein